MTTPTKAVVRRIIREDVLVDLLPGETIHDALERAIACQETLQWEISDCEYWVEGADAEGNLI